MPTTNAIFRPELGALAYEFSETSAKQGFIGSQVLPYFHTNLKSGVYPVISAEAMLESNDTSRAARSAYARGDFSFGQAEYNCAENGWEEPIDDTESALYRNYFDAEAIAVQRATLMVLRSMEKRIADKVFASGNGIERTPAKTAWDDLANADPLADITAVKEAFRYKTGVKPNAIVMDEEVFRNLSMCEAVMERVRFTDLNAIRGELTVQQLQAYFNVEKIIVAGAVSNTAAKGKAVSIKPIWPTDKVLVARVSTGGQDLREPALGRTFIWDEDAPDVLVTESYREEQTRSNIYRVRQYTGEVIQFAGAGHIITGVGASK